MNTPVEANATHGQAVGGPSSATPTADLVSGPNSGPSTTCATHGPTVQAGGTDDVGDTDGKSVPPTSQDPLDGRKMQQTKNQTQIWNQ